jgi:hypothetical protein
MEAVTATILPLGFAMDLMVQRVLTCMRRKAQRGVAVEAHGWLELETGWEHARGSEVVVRSQEGNGSGSESDRRKKKGEWAQPRLGLPYL